MEFQLNQHYNEYLMLKGYCVHLMPPDGNCLFHSIAASLGGYYGKYMTDLDDATRNMLQMNIRREIQAYINEHLEDYLPFVGVNANEIRNGDDHLKMQLYKIARIEENNFWCGEETIVAASKLYQRKIIVEVPVRDQKVYGPEFGGDPIILSFVNGNHYDLLELQKDKQTTDPATLTRHLDDYLRFNKLTRILVPAGMNQLYHVISLACKGNVNRYQEVKDDLRHVLLYNADKFSQDIIDKIGISEPTDDDFVDKVLDHPSQADDLLLKVACECYKKTIVVERPLERIKYEYQNADQVFLAKTVDGDYQLLESAKPPEVIIEDQEEVVFIEESESAKNQMPGQSEELMFILSNVLKSLQSPITVIFLIPIPNLEDYTLDEAILNSKPDVLYHMVIYNEKDYNKLKGDLELKGQCTMYSYTFRGIRPKSILRRMNQLAAYVIPYLFLTMKGTTWRGIRIETMAKFNSRSMPVILLRHCWSTVKDVVIPDLQKLIKHNDKLICLCCNSKCELKNVFSHFDASKFHKRNFDSVTSSKMMDKFNLFDTDETRLPQVVKKIRSLRSSFNTNAVDVFLDYLNENTTKSSRKWTTYLVLHVDGENMDDYQDESMYYAMLNDPKTVKSIYVGTTTDDVFRRSHFIQESSLSETFSASGKLYMLRSKKYENLKDAHRDEAVVIEIITIYLHYTNSKREKSNFLFLNKHSQQKEILEEYKTSHPKEWAEFATSNIPLFNTDPQNHDTFNIHDFTGNYRPSKELKVVNRKFTTRQFSDLAQVYRKIRTRQI